MRPAVKLVRRYTMGQLRGLWWALSRATAPRVNRLGIPVKRRPRWAKKRLLAYEHAMEWLAREAAVKAGPGGPGGGGAGEAGSAPAPQPGL